MIQRHKTFLKHLVSCKLYEPVLKKNNFIGCTTVVPGLPVGVTPEASPAANLPFHWRNVLTQGKSTSVSILHSNAVKLIPTSQGIFILDSHLHASIGAHVAFAEWQPSYELLS